MTIYFLKNSSNGNINRHKKVVETILKFGMHIIRFHSLLNIFIILDSKKSNAQRSTNIDIKTGGSKVNRLHTDRPPCVI